MVSSKENVVPEEPSPSAAGYGFLQSLKYKCLTGMPLLLLPIHSLGQNSFRHLEISGVLLVFDFCLVSDTGSCSQKQVIS